MTELSNVLREVLRALGVEGWEGSEPARRRDAGADAGDHHCVRRDELEHA